MKTIEYRHEDVDKTEWGDGPWITEPDKVQWLDEETGLPCMIKRNHQGNWCGYVGVSKGHPCYEASYNDYEDDDALVNGISVHGGLTFSEFCQPHDPGKEAHAICHVVEDGEDDKVWWLGFDCGHGGDFMPGLHSRLKKYGHDGLVDDPRGMTYRDQAYVTGEVLSLAKQLKAMEV